MSKMRKLITLLLALTLIFASVVPVMAAQIDDPGYEIPNAVNGEIHVKLNIQGYSITSGGVTTGPIQQYNLDVALGQANVDEAFTVKDVLTTADSDYSNILDFNITTDSAHGYYLKGIKDVSSGIWYEALPMKKGSKTYYCGWMFRVNEKIIMANSVNGASIGEAYVKDGDVIDVFYANPYTSGDATLYQVVTYNSALAKLQLLMSKLYIPNGSSNWTINDFTEVASQYVRVYVDGTLDTNMLMTSSNGTFNVSGTYTGEHMVRVVSLSSAYQTFTDPSNSSITYNVPKYLDAYTKITF